MIRQLIATPSVSCFHAHLDMSNRAVIDLLANWMESRGFDIEIQSVDESKFNLIARAGSGSDGLVLSGHTDTVPYNADLWQSDPFQLRQKYNRLYGLGSCDMKSFLALALTASTKFDFSKLKRPSVIKATSLPRPLPMIAEVGDNISRIPGPPIGPS